jgi:hypothetical protein
MSKSNCFVWSDPETLSDEKTIRVMTHAGWFFAFVSQDRASKDVQFKVFRLTFEHIDQGDPYPDLDMLSNIEQLEAGISGDLEATCLHCEDVIGNNWPSPVIPGKAYSNPLLMGMSMLMSHELAMQEKRKKAEEEKKE